MTFGRDANRRVQDVMRQQKADLALATHVVFYFYGRDKTGKLLAAVEKEGLRVVSRRRDALIVDDRRVVEGEEFDLLTERLIAAAKEAGCEYDGWEAAVRVEGAGPPGVDA